MNTSHLPGRNIPLDLHMEHSNRLAKSAMRNLGSNKTREKSIARVGRSLGTLVPLLGDSSCCRRMMMCFVALARRSMLFCCSWVK